MAMPRTNTPRTDPMTIPAIVLPCMARTESLPVSGAWPPPAVAVDVVVPWLVFVCEAGLRPGVSGCVSRVEMSEACHRTWIMGAELSAVWECHALETP